MSKTPNKRAKIIHNYEKTIQKINELQKKIKKEMENLRKEVNEEMRDAKK